MLLTLDANDKRPLYQQIVESVKALIARGELQDGMSLPPVRQVAASLGISLNTIAIAYRQLQDEGLLAIKHGAGAVVARERRRTDDSTALRKTLRAALAQMILAGFNDREIIAVAREELRLAHGKGDSR